MLISACLHTVNNVQMRDLNSALSRFKQLEEELFDLLRDFARDDSRFEPTRPTCNSLQSRRCSPCRHLPPLAAVPAEMGGGKIEKINITTARISHLDASQQ